MDVYAQIIDSIISHQEAIIGPVAVEQARHIPNLKLQWENNHQITVVGDPALVIDHLVRSYRHLFGQISVEVSKEAAAELIGQLHPDHLPQTLR